MNVHVTSYGSGFPHRFVIGGLGHTSEDYEAIADAAHLGTWVVADNPDHKIRRKTIKDPQEWRRMEAEYREQLIAEMVRHGCDRIVAHSRGCMRTLRLIEDIHRGGQEQPSSVVFLAPPSSKDAYKASDVARDGSKQPVRILLSDLLDEMEPKEFDHMARRHEKEYGDNVARICKESPLSADIPEVRRLLTLYHGNLLVISSEHDRWHDRERLEQMTIGMPHVTVEKPLQGMSHYPHVQAPMQVGEIIATWEAALPPRRQQHAA